MIHKRGKKKRRPVGTSLSHKKKKKKKKKEKKRDVPERENMVCGGKACPAMGEKKRRP